MFSKLILLDALDSKLLCFLMLPL